VSSTSTCPASSRTLLLPKIATNSKKVCSSAARAASKKPTLTPIILIDRNISDHRNSNGIRGHIIRFFERLY
jgi:hypothetical protein